MWCMMRNLNLKLYITAKRSRTDCEKTRMTNTLSLFLNLF